MMERDAAAVLAAFDAAEKDRLPSVDCYRAAVDAWRAAHPDHSATYAGMQAVAVILDAKAKLRIDD